MSPLFWGHRFLAPNPPSSHGPPRRRGERQRAGEDLLQRIGGERHHGDRHHGDLGAWAQLLRHCDQREHHCVHHRGGIAAHDGVWGMINDEKSFLIFLEISFWGVRDSEFTTGWFVSNFWMFAHLLEMITKYIYIHTSTHTHVYIDIFNIHVPERDWLDTEYVYAYVMCL